MREGRHAARNVMHVIRGESSEPFNYIDKGTLAAIGRGAAVDEVGRLRLGGFVGSAFAIAHGSCGMGVGLSAQ